MKATQEIDALVLRSYPSGDYDMVYRLLSPQKGKVSAFARSVRRSKKRFSALPEPFDLGRAELKPGRGDLLIFGGFVPMQNFRKLRDSLTLFTTACTICECFDVLTVEHAKEGKVSPSHAEHDQELYQTAVDSLSALCDVGGTMDPLLPAERAIRKLMRISGFLEDNSRQDELSTEAQWHLLLDRVEEIIERPLKSRQAMRMNAQEHHC